MFITFEGPDNTGKTTTLNALADSLTNSGKQVLVTKEPGNLIGVRDLILDKNRNLSERTVLMLFLADRAEHLDKVVLPALRKGSIVLCDRSSLSTLAYFAAEVGNEDPSYLISHYGFLHGALNFIHTFEGKPDLCFMFKQPSDMSGQELDQDDRIEAKGADFQAKVAKAFESLTIHQTLFASSCFYPKQVVLSPEIGKHTTEEIVQALRSKI